MSDDDETDVLDEEDEDRLNRVRGKRDSRPSRRRSRSGEPEQAEQAPQAEQAEGAEDSGSPMKTDTTTAAGQDEQAQQAEEPDVEQQPPQAEQASVSERPNVSQLEPVTSRRHDTYYLSDDVTSELERVYRRMSLDVLEETGVDLDDQRVGGRNRYFRPLALLLGARQIAEMSPDELRETIEEEDLIDDLPEADN